MVPMLNKGCDYNATLMCTVMDEKQTNKQKTPQKKQKTKTKKLLGYPLLYFGYMGIQYFLIGITQNLLPVAE